MPVRIRQILRSRAPSGRGTTCRACGEGIPAHSHAIQRGGDVYHAACVLYGPRPHPPGATHLRATR